MADEVVLTPEESLKLLSDSILQSIIHGDEVSKANRQICFGQLPPKAFRDENYIIYSVYHSFKDRGITPDEQFMRMYLLRNTKIFRDSQEHINLQEFADLHEDPYVAYTSAVMKQYVRLLGLETLSRDELSLNIEKYKSEFKCSEMNKAYSQSRMILYEGVQIGNRFYQGYEDSVAYMKKKTADIDSILNHTAGVGFIDSSVSGVTDDDEAEHEKIGDFGLIKELNKHLGGIYTGIFYNVMAPTKGGKSKFCTRVSHIIAVEYGINISVWAHEGGYKAWWAQLRAIHYEYLYIRNKPENERPVALSQKEILYKQYPSPEVKALEEASRLDLFTNPHYGVIHMIDRPFLAENLIDEIETSVQLNNSRFILIDYLQLITTQVKNKQKNQVIGDAYQAVLSYTKKRNVAAMSPSQFTQEFMNEMAHSKDGQAHEVRTAGGESSEIVRTPDINIALYASTEDLIRKEMTIMSIPSRLCEPFPDIRLYADLKVSLFASIDEE